MNTLISTNTHTPVKHWIFSKNLIAVVDVIKLFLKEIQISPKLRNGKKFVLMSEPALKYENNASFKQI